MQKLSKPLSFLLLILFAGFFITSGVQASPPVVHLSAKPAWLNTYKDYNKSIPARDVDNGYFYQLIEEQIQVEKQADYSHVIRQIVSDAGIQNGSEISISFDPSYQRLDFHEIIVWRDNKPQNRLSAGSFKMIADEQELSKFIYQGTYSAYCILADIRKGDKIEYSYTITGRNPILGNQFCHNLFLQQSQPIAHLYKAILASPQRKLNFKAFNKVPKTAISDKNGLKCYEWEDFQVQPAHDYDNQPGWYTSYGYIQVSDYNSWQDVVNWALKINPIALNIGGKLAKQIAVFKTESGNDKEKYFRNAVKLVQDEIRYMGIEMGEYSHRANNPEKVYEQRYGDCKDKSLLLASILNAGGIPANIVLINTGARSKTDQYLPSPYVFDHAIVVATVNDRQVWIDPTISYQRGTGINLYFPGYGEGLVIKQGINALTTIPLSKAGTINCRELYTVPADNGKVSLDVITKYTLNQADNIRQDLASSSLSETEKSYLNYYAKTYPKIEAKDSVTITDNEEKNELTTIEHYLIPGFFKKDTVADRYEASFYADYISRQLGSANTKSPYPLSLNYPYAINYTTCVVLPSGWIVENKQTSIKRDAYSFASKIAAIGDTLFLNYQFSYLKDFIPVNKLDEYRADVKQIKDEDLSYSFNYAPDRKDAIFRLNYWMLFGVIAFVLTIVVIGVRIYRTPTNELIFEPGANFTPLGGWLILIAIGLAISILVLLVSLSKGVYFDLNKWNSHLNNKSEYTFKALFTFEAFCNVFLMCYTFFCLILLLNKRDILPKHIIWLYIFALSFFILDFGFGKLIFNSGEFYDDTAKSIIRTAIYAAIWIPYFKMSYRVKETFIVPYPATNFSFKTQEPAQIKDDEGTL